MIFEVRGAGFDNKGAELMLRSVTSRLRERDPDVEVALEPTEGVRFAQRSRLGLRAIYPSEALLPGRLRSVALRSATARGAMFAAMKALHSGSVDSMLGLADRRRCDALLDIAGYAYGDKFPPLKTRVAADVAQAYHRRGKPVVFLPQMFGPFEKAQVAAQFRRAAEHSSLIYARDDRSYELARGVLGDDARLRLCPDITIASLPPKDDTAVKDDEPYACVVPNERMVDQGRQEWGETYLARLLATLGAIERAGLRPVLVIHTSDPGDRQMAEQLQRDMGSSRVGLFADPDPYRLKAVLGGARFVVGSRFHSLVAALSMGVPAIALGWAHKYEMLARDFGVPELQHRGVDPPDALAGLVERLVDEPTNAALRETIQLRASDLRAKVEVMWSDVHNLIEQAH